MCERENVLKIWGLAELWDRKKIITRYVIFFMLISACLIMGILSIFDYNCIYIILSINFFIASIFCIYETKNYLGAQYNDAKDKISKLNDLNIKKINKQINNVLESKYKYDDLKKTVGIFSDLKNPVFTTISSAVLFIMRFIFESSYNISENITDNIQNRRLDIVSDVILILILILWFILYINLYDQISYLKPKELWNYKLLIEEEISYREYKNTDMERYQRKRRK